MRLNRPLGEGKAIVQLVLPHAWVAQINRLAMERGVNRSALIREAIAATLLRDHAEGGEQGNQALVLSPQR
jgi:hypothetical protein